MIYGLLLELLTQEGLKYGPAVASRRQRWERVWLSSPAEGLFALFLFLAGVTSRDWSIAGTIKYFEGISVISSKYGDAALAKRRRRRKNLQKSSLWSSQEYSFALVATRTHSDCVSQRKQRKNTHRVYVEFKLRDEEFKNK